MEGVISLEGEALNCRDSEERLLADAAESGDPLIMPDKQVRPLDAVDEDDQ